MVVGCFRGKGMIPCCLFRLNPSVLYLALRTFEKMRAEYYLVYRTSKGDENSASEAVLLGDLPPELLEALEIDIEESNANDDVGEIVLAKKQNLSHSEKERFDYLTIDHLWKHRFGNSNPTLSHLQKHYLKCNIGDAESECWEILTGRPYPPESRVLHTIEAIQWATDVIASIPKCSGTDNCNNNAMMEYALRLIRLYEIWLSPTGIRQSFTIREMFLYFRRCLAWTGNDYSDEKIRDLLKLNNEHKELIQLQPEQDSGLEEHYYELTDLGRARAVGSLKCLHHKHKQILSLADLKPPGVEKGDWFSVEKTAEILNDILKLKKKSPLSESTLRTRREGVARLQDEETGYWHGKDTEGVFFRFKRRNEPPEYFILCKKDSRLPKYPKLVDSASDSPPPEAKILKKLKK